MANAFYAAVKGEFGPDPLNAKEIALAITAAAGRMKRAGHIINETSIVIDDRVASAGESDGSGAE